MDDEKMKNEQQQPSETQIPAVDLQTDNRRRDVATAAGLSSLHGGKTGRTVLTWEGECSQERGTLLTVSRIWESAKGEPPTHLPMECPICNEEHMIQRRT